MHHLNQMIDKVLLIDDDADDRFFFNRALKEITPQTQLKMAGSYNELTQVLTSYLPDIIFVDINMPGHNGFQCLEALMANPLFRTIPVIMHSSSSNPSHIALAYSYGANLYFKKPSHYKVLVMGLRKVLDLDWMHPKWVTANQFSDGQYADFKVA